MSNTEGLNTRKLNNDLYSNHRHYDVIKVTLTLSQQNTLNLHQNSSYNLTKLNYTEALLFIANPANQRSPKRGQA